MTYAVTFTASATGTLVSRSLYWMSGDVLLAGPAGTVFNSGQDSYYFDDLTSGATGSVFGSEATVSDGGSAISIPVPVPVAAGDKVTVTAPGVTSTTATGGQSLKVSTTSDTTPATVGYTLAKASPVTGVAVSVSTRAAGASQVRYAVTFTASATGTLVSRALYWMSGDVVLAGPAGTVFNGLQDSYYFDDLTSGATGSVFGSQSTVSDGGAAISIPVPIPIAVGDQVTVTATGVSSTTGTGPQSLKVATTSDTTPATVGYTLAKASPVTGVRVTVSRTQVTVPHTQYEIGFATSATGNLLSGGIVTITAPPGTVFPAANGLNYCVQVEGRRPAHRSTTSAFRTGTREP